MHDDLKGFEISVNKFGEIVSSVDINELHAFLDKHVDDKKVNNKSSKNPDDKKG